MRREPFPEPAALADPPGLRVTVAALRTAAPVVLGPSRPWTVGRASAQASGLTLQVPR